MYLTHPQNSHQTLTLVPCPSPTLGWGNQDHTGPLQSKHHLQCSRESVLYHVTPQVVKTWRKELSKINAKAAESLADPGQYPNLFPDLDLALKAEQHQRDQRKQTVPAQDFQDYEGSTMANLIEEIRGERRNHVVHD